MCLTRKIIYQSKNGIITYCNRSHLFQVMYNNLCFELFEWELEAFKEHLFNLDINYWQNQLKCTATHRKIPLSVGTKHFIILLSKIELAELKALLSIKPKKINILKYSDIDYRFIEN
ncbi:DUF6686 family protein [Croceitalea rosinachiae]|uniref:DUF6686 family protein n=1 Tax=Croceitalea rosinachiae TaxID=3075596 RepID=A0ABU3AEL0_9FLAO|nr:DUF6686 family protein [Croceitalea sp. F388]MDT0608240.1 DUF6686 family protein [Croceitalea sp. F388]